MLDFFYILTKGGLVLWCVPASASEFLKIINDAIDKTILQGQGLAQKWIAPLGSHHIHYKLDNEFELIFILGFQKTLNISYADKFLDEIQKRFRDEYKDDLVNRKYNRHFVFRTYYEKTLSKVEQEEDEARKAIRKPRTFEESDKNLKNKKIVTKKSEVNSDKPKKNETKVTPAPKPIQDENSEEIIEEKAEPVHIQQDLEENIEEDRNPLEQLQPKELSIEEKLRLSGKQRPGQFSKAGPTKTAPKVTQPKKKTLAEPKTNQTDTSTLDYTRGATSNGSSSIAKKDDSSRAEKPTGGNLATMNVEEHSTASALVDGFWSKLKKVNVFASKTLTQEDLRVGIDTMREHLISKNVAADVADKICESVSSKLDGKTLGSFESLSKNIRAAMRETLVSILTPKRRIDILRDVVDAKKQKRPYVITFCGVNGVGKSTNLAKVAYWLAGNNLRILIAGCDTFRSGAIEQLQTHVHHLNDIFNEKDVPMIELFSRGYGKDPAGIATQAIHYAKDKNFDVVLIDTAGRMQNDEPLMIALAKLIHVNNPDLVLFVGEALVGNEAVDQVTKFNQALIDHARLQSEPRVIDGIVLTKFDTINDKVGAAISMTYTTDKPIVFVGIGQRYQDLKTINADVVTDALLK